MHRFFVPTELIEGEAVRLVGDVADQLVRVLLARLGEQIVVLDNTRWGYLVTLESLSRR
jgi:16S rRNA U1498 N3-methylase RsmE